MSKKTKSLLILLMVLTIGLVGLTIAYFANSSTVANQFITSEYGTTYTEEFVSPTNWLPGTTTTKTVEATNTGSVDEAVRLSISESWKTANNGTLSGWIHQDGTKSTHSTEAELSTDERVAVLNFANTSDWTKVGDYYYYNYKIAPGEETSSFLESVTFNPKTQLDDTCETTIGEGTKTITCTSSGDDYDHATYTLTINIETVQYNKYNEAWNLNNSVSIASTSKPVVVEPEEPETPVVEPTGVEKLASIATNASDAEYNDTTKKNMFVFTHGSGANQVTESRYIGNDPNNYVYFNCTNDSDTSTCEKWRIIGTFDVERTDPTDSSKTITETRMKLVRGSDFATTMKWDDRVCETCSGNALGKNDWEGSYMNNYLNGTYLESLSATAQSQIEDAIYYLGGFQYNQSTSTEQIYSYERGTETCVTTGSCSGGTRSTSWEGKVALMYPSDMYMTYAKTDGVGCYNQPMNSGVCVRAKSWIYNTNKLENGTSYQWTWLLSPRSNDAYHVFAGSSSYLDHGGAHFPDGCRPVVYLKSDIKIDSGTGEEGNPYVLK